MKTIALCFFAALAMGCSAAAPSEEADSAEGAMQTNSFGDVSPGAQEAVRLLSAKPLSSMTIAASGDGPSAWRFDMSATGFVVVGIDDRGRDNSKLAYAIDTSGAEASITGIAVDDPYARSKVIRDRMAWIKADLDAARAAVPEMEDPAMPEDPTTWKPKPAEHCSSSTNTLINAAFAAGFILAVGGLFLTYSGVGAPVGVIVMGAGYALVGATDAANALVCNEKSTFWNTEADHAGR